jgi:hypothetical protein
VILWLISVGRLGLAEHPRTGLISTIAVHGFSFLGHYFADIYKPGKDHQPKRYRRDQNRKPFVELLM